MNEKPKQGNIEKITDDNGKVAIHKLLGSLACINTTMPRGWRHISDKYAPSDEDKQNGLTEFLYDTRNTAAKAIGDLFFKVGLKPEQYSYIYGMQIGIDEESDAPGAYYPGLYGIIVGRYSDEIFNFVDSDQEERQKIKNNLAATMAHELIHSIQTVRLTLPKDGFATIGDVMAGWKDGLDEGMAEAFGYIAIEIYNNESSIEEAAQKLEKFCVTADAPATQMSARIIHKMKPELLSWYLGCAQTEEYKTKNPLQEAFGDSYNPFLKNMVRLYSYENNNDIDEDELKGLVGQTTEMIDNALENK